MKLYKWCPESLRYGIPFWRDRFGFFGPVVTLGKKGSGDYITIKLDEFYPPTLAGDRIIEAYFKRWVISGKKGKPGITFPTLKKVQEENEMEGFLLHICTNNGFSYMANGRYESISGAPEFLLTAIGTFGKKKRTGAWEDGLVAMRGEDVLRVYPSRGQDSYAIWIENGKPQTAKWESYESMWAMDKMQSSPQNTFDNMPAVTFTGGEIIDGIRIKKVIRGRPAVLLGEAEHGAPRGRIQSVVPLIVPEGMETPSVIRSVIAVKYAKQKMPSQRPEEEKKEVKRIFGLVLSDERRIGNDAVLLRISTSGHNIGDMNGEVKIYEGYPVILASGQGAHADSSGTWQDCLVVMREGDMLLVHQEGESRSEGSWVLSLKNGKPCCQSLLSRRLDEAKADPEFYTEKNMAPVGYVPSSWLGRIVTAMNLQTEESDCGPEASGMHKELTGELISCNFEVVLNLGWNGCEYFEQRVSDCAWIHLLPDKQVVRLTEEQMKERKQLCVRAEGLKNTACTYVKEKQLKYVHKNLTEQIKRFAGASFSLMPNNELVRWIETARQVIEEVSEIIIKKDDPPLDKCLISSLSNPGISLRIKEKGRL